MNFTPDLFSIYKKDLAKVIIRRGEANLISIISRENNLKNSIKLVFSLGGVDEENQPLLPGCVNFFLYAPQTFYAFLTKSSVFIEGVNQFLAELDTKIPTSIGLFSRIMELCFNADKSVLERINDFNDNFAVKTILENSDMVSISDVGVLFLTKPDFLNTKIEYLSNIFEKCEPAIYCLHRSIKKDPTVISETSAAILAESLFKFANEKNNSVLFRQKALLCIYIIRNNTDSDQLEDVILRNHDFVDDSLFPTLKLYEDIALKHLDSIFDRPFDIYNGKPIVKAFKKLSKEKQIKIAEEQNLPEKILSIYNKTHHSGLVMELAHIIDSTGIESPCTATEEWKMFVHNILEKQLFIIENPYGGELPSKDESIELDINDNIEPTNVTAEEFFINGRRFICSPPISNFHRLKF